jgi:hypothetical protein
MITMPRKPQQIERDDGPLTAAQLRQIRKLTGRNKKKQRSMSSSLFKPPKPTR